MKNKIFVDTNILVYTIDTFDKDKQKKSRKLLKEIAVENIGVMSTQVIQEFYVTAAKKLSINPLLIKEIINSFEKFEIVQISISMIKEAIDLSMLHKISFWDALIIVSAENAKCHVLLTEDLNSEQMIKGVKIINPFIN
ncbi:MAG: PIN domain-containing protein [Ignavibacteriaceae bacterium]